MSNLYTRGQWAADLLVRPPRKSLRGARSSPSRFFPNMPSRRGRSDRTRRKLRDGPKNLSDKTPSGLRRFARRSARLTFDDDVRTRVP